MMQAPGRARRARLPDGRGGRSTSGWSECSPPTRTLGGRVGGHAAGSTGRGEMGGEFDQTLPKLRSNPPGVGAVLWCVRAGSPSAGGGTRQRASRASGAACPGSFRRPGEKEGSGCSYQIWGIIQEAFLKPILCSFVLNFMKYPPQFPHHLLHFGDLTHFFAEMRDKNELQNGFAGAVRIIPHI